MAKNKKIILGVTGGIAAYKSAEMVRCLGRAGFQVRVVMSAAATQFITPLTLQTLSGHPVHQALLDPERESQMPHIELARWADMLLIAPASAHCLAKLANGLADDLLSTLCLATVAPLWVAPAMNSKMWQHPATQENIRVLRQRNVQILGPDEGQQACGETGPGRMKAPQALLRALLEAEPPQTLAGVRVLLNAGPTQEAIDPVRFISNRSSGRMGFALAAAARALGAEVCLVSGPVHLATPEGVRRIDVVSAQEMCEAVLAKLAWSDIFIAVAAVADYRPTQSPDHKIKKTTAPLSLALSPCPDILALAAKVAKPPFLVGFAAETEHLAKYAQGKRQAKNLDMIAANLVGAPGAGFESATNSLTVFWQQGERHLASDSKENLARTLMALVADRYITLQAGEQCSK